MASLTTIFRLSQALVVALLVALVGAQGDARCGAASVAVQASQIAVTQTALSSAPPATTPRTWSVRRHSSLRDLAESEIESGEEDLEGGDEDGSPASSNASVDLELLSRWKDLTGSRRTTTTAVIVSHWMPTGHPRGPPA